MEQIIMATQGEMVLKGMNRRSFEKVLLKSIKSRLSSLGEWSIRSAQSAMYIEPTDDTAKASVPTAYEMCQKIFGIAAVSLSTVCKKDMQDIQQTVLSCLNTELENVSSFKVVAKRSDKTFPLNSMQISRELGGFLLDKYPGLSVDVHNPQLIVGVEVRETAAYVHGGKKKGAGGLPVPTSGRAALLLSGGIDSPVAGWMMAKRGLGLVAVHFASPPYTSPRAAAKVEQLALEVSQWCGPLPYYAVEYTKAQEYLRDKLEKQNYFTVLMRRSMMRIARVISEKEQCLAMITGESLAQVASQTMQALACTDTAQDLPVLRPCIGMDKIEITEIARRIGTFETSILPYEDCCTIFTPPHPKTKPKMEDVLACEAALTLLPELEAEAAALAVFKLIGK